jgi:hypothetical protein
MAFSISQQRTVLWDQIKYQGNPSEFVWALPVRPGTVVEVSRDQWMSALDAVSRPVILSPADNSGGGCGLGCSSTTTAVSDTAGGSRVEVVNQSVVGPYESVTLRSRNPKALEDWLTGNGYAIQDAVRPTIAAYVNEGFDFIALRLQPGVGVAAMQPVRIVTPGADVGLPLRMVAAGVGANVAITLFVISEGRYQTQNFPNAVIDNSKLVWDYGTQSSNYQSLSVAAMAANDGRTFLTEYAGKQSPTPTPAYSPNLATLYYQQCGNPITPTPDPAPDPTPDDGGVFDPFDAGVATSTDAGDLGDAATDGGVDDAATDVAQADAASSTDASWDDAQAPSDDAGLLATDDGSVPIDPRSCAAFDDLRLATEGMDPASVTLTRLRAFLPSAALAQDLTLEASPEQTDVSNVHFAQATASAGQASVSPTQSGGAGSLLIAGATGLAVLLTLRRRPNRKER